MTASNGQEGRATWPLSAEPRTCPTCGLVWPRDDDDPDTDGCAAHRTDGWTVRSQAEKATPKLDALTPIMRSGLTYRTSVTTPTSEDE